MAQPSLEKLNQIREAVRDQGVITWWPGGPSHNAICKLLDDGEMTSRDVSGSQETKYEIRFAPGYQ